MMAQNDGLNGEIRLSAGKRQEIRLNAGKRQECRLNESHLSSFTIYIELEGHKIAQNNVLNEADKNFFQNFIRGHFWAKNIHFGPKIGFFGEPGHIY